MTHSQVLYVAWQDPESRRILPIGRVTRSETGEYEFAYIRAVAEAQKQGFLPLLSFPDVNLVYRSREMMPLLHNRLVQSGRPDYQNYLEQLGLSSISSEPFAVLSRSGGRRTTDKLELFSPPTLRPNGELCSVVLARGVRHLPGAEETISALPAGAVLDVRLDPTNRYNSRALKLSYKGTTLGFLPDYLATELDVSPESINALVLKVNLPPAPVHHRVLLAVTFPASEPRPFSGLSYQPITVDGSMAA